MGGPAKNSDGLTRKQQAFVEAYSGNGVQAARVSGYQGSDATLSQVALENLRKPVIRKAIQERNVEALSPLIATRLDRQKFWTRIMMDESAELRDRLRASELLGRSEADFTEKVDLNGVVNITVADPYAPRPDTVPTEFMPLPPELRTH